MAISLHVLGGPALRGPDGLLTGPPVQRHRVALLALLAVAHPRPVARDRLIALLWPERDTRHARPLLSLAVHVLRAVAGRAAIRTSGDGLALDGDALAVDLVAFVRAREHGDAETAAACYGGPLLDGFHLGGDGEFDRWLDDARARLAGDYADSLVGCATLRLARGDRAGAVAAWRALGMHALHDSATALRVTRGLARLGARSEALAFVRRHTNALRADLDTAPSGALVAYAARLRTAPPDAALGTRAAPDISRGDPCVDREAASLLCLKGRHFWTQRGPGQLRKAIDCFERALVADPRSSAAYAGLADAWAVLGFYSFAPPAEAFARAREAARAAHALEPLLADSFASVAYVRMYHDWRWDAAARGYRRALAIDPRSAKAHQWLGNLLVVLGRHDEAIARMQQVRALTPLSPMAHAVLGWACYHAGRHDEAGDHLLESIELDPHFAVAHLWLGQSLAERGEWDAAVASLERATTLFHGAPIAELALAHAEARAGAREVAAGRVTRLRAAASHGAYVPRYELAKAELALGQRDAALCSLARAHRERSLGLAFVRADPQLAALRAEGRVDDLVRAMGL